MKKILPVLVVLSAALLVSCGKKEKPEEDLNIMNAAEKYGGVMSKTLKKSKAMDDMLYMKNKINTFHVQEGRYPYSLNELVEKKYLDSVPEPPTGMAFHYDSSTGKIDIK
jgi:hypothetical protein